jgi:hypothetical protein
MTNKFFLKVDFPAFTVCSPGFNNQNLAAGFYKKYLNFLEEHGAKVNATPYYVSSVFRIYFEVKYISLFSLITIFEFNAENVNVCF